MTSPPLADLVAEVSRAWAAGDAEAFAAHYAPDATAILPGFHLRDRADIRSSMATAFAGPLRGSRRVHEIQAERHYAADTAVVVTRSATLHAGESEPPPARWSLATWLLRLDGERWLVAAYHDCPEATR
jgi:uncharacterized protein (TIGR02246 family)